MAAVESLYELPVERRTSAGGKGGTLAQLRQAGYPVPDGFVILPDAFSGDALRREAWTEVQAHLARLRKDEGDVAFAVRSSALGEDSARASFAGEFETVLAVRTDDEIREAVHTVRRSRRSERAQAYSKAKGLDGGQEMEMAVVVQQLVRAELSGVLFTVDPVSGSRTATTGHFVQGLGDRLVSGEVSGQAFTLKRRGGIWPQITYDGPPAMRRFGRWLYRLGRHLERELGGPQDVEWAIAGGKLFLLQSRPITTLMGHNPVIGEWNDSLSGEFLWSNVNFGEAMPDVMTPLTWSVVYQLRFGEWRILPEYTAIGNIGGRPYLNLSIFASVFQALGRSDQDLLDLMEGTLYTRLPEEMEIPTIPLSLCSLLAALSRLALMQVKERRAVMGSAAYLASNPRWCKAMRGRIQRASAPAELITLWREEIEPHLKRHFWTVLGSANQHSDCAMRLRRDLTGLVGPDDADTLLSSLSDGSDLLASLGPVAGLAKVARGEMDRAAYLGAYGHRGPHECELSIPRLAEDPEWLDRQLAQCKASPIDVEALLRQQREAFEAAWERLKEQRPREARSLRRRIDEAASLARQREAVRSEFARDLGVVRAFALRAGSLTDLREDVFFLTCDELLDLLSGKATASEHIAARREAHARYEALPLYPTIIRGRFDPFQWAVDPERCSDVYDARGQVSSLVRDTVSQNVISGCPGAAGRVEGVVRRLDRPDEGGQLLPGEILVTRETNVGWTLLFPRVTALVTDVGAPLSHAAIVARELGVPAVVGCGDATARLKTGDRVWVDGGRGTVRILR